MSDESSYGWEKWRPHEFKKLAKDHKLVSGEHKDWSLDLCGNKLHVVLHVSCTNDTVKMAAQLVNALETIALHTLNGCPL